jgi:RecA-family ATPase
MPATWQIRDEATKQRKCLRGAGYLPIPATGKAPPISGWQNVAASDDDIDSWFHDYPDALNTGIITRTAPAVDIDIYDPDIADEIEELLWDMIGSRGMVRFGQSPKRAALFRTDAPFGKIATPVFTSPTKQRHRVEVLCDGQQIIVDGTHPGTHQPYRWHGGVPGEVLLADLPELTKAMAEQFITRAAALMREHGWIEEVRRTNGAGPHPGANRVGGGIDFAAMYGSREQKYAAAALQGCADELAAMPQHSGRNNKLNALAYRMGTMVARDWISRNPVTQRLYEAAAACLLIHDDGEAATTATIASGLGSGEMKPHLDLDNAKPDEGGGADEPLGFIDMIGWDTKPPPPRLWSVRERIPLRQPTLFSGEGAIGKTLLALQLLVAHALGRDWIGMMPELGPAIYFGCEDDADEIHRRVADIAAHYRVTFADLIAGGLHLLSFAGKDAILGAVNRGGMIEASPLFHRIHKAVSGIQPKCVVIDTSADVFAGNENDRTQVRQFIGLLRRLGIDGNCAVVLCSHPSLAGINTGTGLSGSTGWHNSVRARMFFKTATTDHGEEPDPELRELVFMKNNYGPIGARVLLRWKNGVFVPEPGQGTIEKAVAERKAEELFLKLLDRFGSVTNKKGTSYAPALFAAEHEAKTAKVSKSALADAMGRLFAANKLHLEAYDYPCRKRFRIVAGPKP